MNSVRVLAASVAFLSVAACAASRPPWADGAMITEKAPEDAAPQDLGNLASRVLELHNRERARIGLAPMMWDGNLAVAAASYGPRLASLGRLEHSPSQSRPGQGENLWMGTAGAYSLEEMIGSWAAEKRIFRPGLFPDAVSASGNWSDVAHYTQMIWPATRRVGCAVHSAQGWDYLICRYSPPGNVVGQRVP